MTIALHSPKSTWPGDLSMRLPHLQPFPTPLYPYLAVANNTERHGKRFSLAGRLKMRKEEGGRHQRAVNVASIVRGIHRCLVEVRKLPACLSGKRRMDFICATLLQGNTLRIYGNITVPTNVGLTRSATSGISATSLMSKTSQIMTAGVM